jgi:hypothetical protein
MSQSLEDRIERLARRQTWLLAGIVLTVFVVLWLVFKTTLNLKAEQSSALRTKQLEIVDSAGVACLRLGAPLPDATLARKTLHRRSPASGIQLNNAKGDEVGGLAMTLKNANGNSVPLTGSYDIWAVENVFFMFRSSSSWAQCLHLWSRHQLLRTAR